MKGKLNPRYWTMVCTKLEVHSAVKSTKIFEDKYGCVHSILLFILNVMTSTEVIFFPADTFSSLQQSQLFRPPTAYNLSFC